MRSWLFAAAVLALCDFNYSSGAAQEPQTAAGQTVGIETPTETGDERAQAAGKPLIGAHAPMLSLTTIDGKTIDLTKIYGEKPVYLKFWATWCVPCRQQMPHFEHTYEALGNDVTIVAVNTNFNETPEGVKIYRERQGLKMPIVMDDGRLASALNLRVTPTHILIDRNGKIVFVGHSADHELDEALQKLKTSLASTRTETAERVADPVAPAPQTAAITSAGDRFPFADPEGHKLTALIFFVPWCEDYLRSTQPDASSQCGSAREQGDRLATAGSVRVIGVASGLWTNAADLAKYEMQNRVAIPLTLDASGGLFRAFRVTRSPTIVVIGPDGREVRRYVGSDIERFARSVQPVSGDAVRPLRPVTDP